MPVVFTDNFNRADGPPGAGWTVQSGTWAISGNTLKSTVAGIIRSNTAPAGSDVATFCTVPGYAGSARTYAFRLRQSADFSYYALVQFSLNAATIVVTIAEATGGAQTTLATRTLNYSYGTTVFLMATANGGHISANLDSSDVLTTWSQATVYQGTCALVTSYSNTIIDDWWQYDLSADSWQISAEEVQNEPGHYSVTLHNPAADWVPGTPGTPTFTCQAGSIQAQEITDAETAVLVYYAPELKSMEIFQDDYNGVTFPLVLTNPSGATGTGESGGGLTTQEHEILLKLETQVDQYLLEQVIYEDPWSVLMGAAWWILGHDLQGQTFNFGRMVAAILDDAEGLAPIFDRIGLARDDIAAMVGSPGYSLFSVQEAITGAQSKDISDVYSLINSLDLGDNQDVLDELARIRTANGWSLGTIVDLINGLDIPEADDNQNVLDELARIRTANNWSLGTLVDLINAIVIPDYSTQLDELGTAVDAIPTNTVTSLQPVLDAISTHNTQLNTQASAILDAIGDIPTNPLTSLQPVLDAINTLDGVLDAKAQLILDAIAALDLGGSYAGAPVWPGLANVVLGTAVDITQGLTITAPMDGVIVSLTSVPARMQYFAYDDMRGYQNVGALSFFDDDGHQERYHALGFTSQVYCPTSMRRAAGLKLRSVAGLTGTVTPWTIDTGA